MKNTKLLTLLVAIALMIAVFAGCTASNPSADTSAPPAAESDDYEEGTSETDTIVNTTAADKVILVASFGTSFNQSRNLAIGGIETAIKNAYPDYQVRRAFTSQIVIDKLDEREGLKIDNIAQAMDRLVLDGVKEVVVQPTTVMNGFEYDDVIAEIAPYADKFESLKVGKWLLADEKDYDEVADLLVQETSGFRSEGTAIVYMGHGTEHESGSIYTKLQETMNTKGYNDYIIGTVEHGIEIDQIQEILSGMDVSKVVLRPFMIVAGDHANNDMASDEDDSWKIILKEDGYTVETVLEGLGQIKGIQELFIRHIKEALEGDSLSVTPTASAVGVTANRIQNGTYSVEVDSDTSMFKIVDCKLTVEDNSMTAVMTLSGQGYSPLYMGKIEDAQTDEQNQISHVLADEKYSFTVPVSALDINIDCAGRGVKSGNWYDHVVVLKSGGLPAEAFVPCQVDATMVGGTGRASIESTATLLYQNGTDIARIVWSSSNYTYMLVDGVEYLPVNTEGNSTFEIPVKFDIDMKVIACTVAMGSPKEIEYSLYFDSSSIK
jgi:sirohydrochlorin cobaltochelatase